MRWLLVFVMVSGAPAFGCSSATRLAGGPIVHDAGGAHRSFGAELLARAAAGTSDTGQGFTGVETTARMVSAHQTQSLGIGLGPAWFRWFGRGLLSMSGSALLGLERYDQTLLPIGSLRGALGGGWAIRDSSHFVRSPWWPDVGSAPRYAIFNRERMALTLEFGVGLDAPLTRSPHLSGSLLIGVAWVKERYSVPEPEWPPFRVR